MIIRALAELPPDTLLDAVALGDILGRCKRSVQRAWRRGELPPPIIFMGKHVWIVRTILEHMQSRQASVAKQIMRGRAQILRDSP